MPCSPTCELEEQTHIRFLVSNFAAEIMFAVLEGFSGKITAEDDESIRNAFEFQYEGARIQVSHIDQVFPGTSHRILMLSGEFIDIVNALDVLLVFYGKELGYNPPLSIIVPELSFQLFTRPGGITSESIYEACGTDIYVLPPHHNDVCSDRLVRVFGSGAQCSAISLILAKLAKDPFYLPPLESPYTYAGDMKKQTHIRLLVSNTAAGSIIEKHGSKSNEFVFMLSDACIQLSRNDETFPGTSERILMVSGTFNNIIMAVELLFSNLRLENHCSTKINVVVPTRFCEAMTGGVTIKSIIEKSMTEINISPPSFSCNVSDSLVTVSGTGSGSQFRQMRAIYLILSKLTEDACYPPPLESPYTYADVCFVCSLESARTGEADGTGFVGAAASGAFLDKAPQVDSATSESNDECDDLMTIDIPSAHVGDINVHDAKNIGNVPQASGAMIRIYDKDECDPSNRKVLISGLNRSIYIAEKMIVNKLEQNLRDDGMLLNNLPQTHASGF